VKEATPLPFRGWLQHAWRIAALWVLLFGAYSNSFPSGFVFDNTPLILEDARVHSATAKNFGLILNGGYWPGHKNSGLYRPITTSSFLLNYAIFGNGADPAGYHWLNLIFHCLNVALVYALGMLIFAAPVPACALAAIWGLHPLMTESVTNIVGRADLLAAFGVLAGLLCYAMGRAEGRRRFVWLAGFACAQAIGLFSKENAVVLPALMILFDLAWRGHDRFARRAPFYAAAAAVFAVFFWCRAQSHPSITVFFTDNPLIGAGFWAARAAAMNIITRYVWLFLWPARLSADYSFNAIPLLGAAENFKAILSLGLCAAAVLWGISRRRTQPALFFFLLFFFVALFPTSNLTMLIGSIMAERFAYLPSVGLAGCLVIGIQAFARQLSKRWTTAPRAAWVATGLLCLAFSARTYARNFDWRNDMALWSSAVQICPESAKAHVNLGRAYSEVSGRIEDAVAEYDIALRIEPDYALAHYNRGTALAKLSGHLDRAILDYTAALRSDPEYAEAHLNLGKALADSRPPAGGNLRISSRAAHRA
jgi:protein O-mannosyl-transferase